MSEVESVAAAVPLIEMIDVAVSDPNRVTSCLVERVDWKLCAGDYWVVAGLPESGKSAFLATAAALNPPLQGELRVFGKNMEELREEDRQVLRRRIGFVFANGGRLFNHLTVAENLTLARAYHENLSMADALNSTSELLETMELTGYAHLTPGRLHRAVAQRVALARALALQPEVLLLDNPLSGLDFPQIRWWCDKLAELFRGSPVPGNKPLTLVITCENLQPLAEQGHQFAVLANRRLRTLGGREALRGDSEPFLRELLTADLK